jgi:predicted DNA-binding transcriptional regulator YafY
MNNYFDLDSAEAEKRVVQILYTNYKGETAVRSIFPLKIWYGSTNWHPQPQWLLDAIECKKKAKRTFALKDVKAWSVE